jgi:hypothetical protein
MEDADPDIPILKQAKAEYAKLQRKVLTESRSGQKGVVHRWQDKSVQMVRFAKRQSCL